MVERKCTQCGAVLSQHNPGKLCFPCQDKIRGELQENMSDGPNYNVDDICSILSLSPEQVRRLGRDNAIPGRIPRIKRHLYLKTVVDQWISSGGKLPETESAIASIGEVEAGNESHDKSISYDKKIFIKSDEIMNERDFRDFLLGLKLHRSYRFSDLIRIGQFWERIGLPSKQHIDPEASKLQYDLWNSLNELIPILQTEFEEENEGKKNTEPVFRFSPCGQKYLNNKAMVERTKAIERDLEQLINTVNENYTAYRGYIRDRFYI